MKTLFPHLLPALGTLAFAAEPTNTTQPQQQADLATLTAQAEAGDAEACFRLARQTLHNRGNESKAVIRLSRAAAAGHAPAQALLGYCYLEGIGLPEKDIHKAVDWISSAALAGDSEAQQLFATLDRKLATAQQQAAGEMPEPEPFSPEDFLRNAETKRLMHRKDDQLGDPSPYDVHNVPFRNKLTTMPPAHYEACLVDLLEGCPQEQQGTAALREAAAALINAGAKANGKGSVLWGSVTEVETTALFTAVKWNDVALAELLLENGADPNARQEVIESLEELPEEDLQLVEQSLLERADSPQMKALLRQYGAR